ESVVLFEVEEALRAALGDLLRRLPVHLLAPVATPATATATAPPLLVDRAALAALAVAPGALHDFAAGRVGRPLRHALLLLALVGLAHGLDGALHVAGDDGVHAPDDVAPDPLVRALALLATTAAVDARERARDLVRGRRVDAVAHVV